MNRPRRLPAPVQAPETPHPVTLAAEAKLLKPAWVVKTYIGLVATSNPAPGEREDGAGASQDIGGAACGTGDAPGGAGSRAA